MALPKEIRFTYPSTKFALKNRILVQTIFNQGIGFLSGGSDIANGFRTLRLQTQLSQDTNRCICLEKARSKLWEGIILFLKKIFIDQIFGIAA